MGDKVMRIDIAVLWLIALGVGIYTAKYTKYIKTGKTVVTVAIVLPLLPLWLLIVLLTAFSSTRTEIYAIAAAVFLISAACAVLGTVWGFGKKKAVYIPLVSAAAVSLMIFGGLSAYERYEKSIPSASEPENILYEYAPYNDNGKVAELDREAMLKIDSDFPKMDGATALYPVYSAFAKAVYPRYMLDKTSDENDCLACSTTAGAYENIVLGDADIIFVAAPSDGQRKFAQDKGVELVFTPIGREAFVFFVNSKNPVNSLTVGDIRDIYSGRIKKWDELGVKNMGKIKAFQREKGSGSQSALEKIMKDDKLTAPIKENVIDGMGGIINETADYKNYKNAIGFSFRFYCLEMVKNNGIKLLNINGTASNRENIENKTYPFVSEFYAVTRGDASENTKKLLDFILSEQGKELIEKTGYTPVK